MAAEMKFILGADVSEALKGMTAVERESIILQKQIEYLQKVVANTSSIKTFNTALDSLARKQAELAKISRQAGASLSNVKPGANEATQSLTNLSRIAQDAPFGFIGIANNINPLVESFGRLKTSTGSTGGALKALVGSLSGAGGLGLAIGVGTALLTVFGDKLFSTKKKAEETESATKKLKDSISGIYSDVAKEATNVTTLVGLLKNETETRERKLQAIKELKQIQPDIFAGLKLEGDQVVGLTSSYANYINSLKTVITAKIKQAQLEQEIEKLLKLEGTTLTGLEKSLFDFTEQNKKNTQVRINGEDDYMGARKNAQTAFNQQEKDRQAAIKTTNAEIKRLTDDISALSKGVKLDIKPPKIKTTKTGTGDSEIIRIAKETAARIQKEGIFQIPIYFDFKEKTNKEQLAIATKFLSDVKNNLLQKFPKIDLKLDVITPDNIEVPPVETEKAVQKLDELSDAFRSALIYSGKPLPTPINQKFYDDLEKNQKVLEQFQKNIKSLKEELIISPVTSAFQSLFKTISDGGNAFKAFANSAINALLGVIQKLLATAAAAAILNFLFPTGIASMGGASGFKGIFNALVGRANGGPVDANSPYIIGERGPELFVPSVSGNILPNNRLSNFNGRPSFASAMGGRSVVRGNDILLASARTQRSQNRVNA